MNPLISAIIPSLNEEKHIKQAIQSILKQNFPRESYEIIVADSSSKDKTVKIAKQYADKIVIGPKKGAGFARNLGAKNAKGKIFAFLDADTIAEKNWLKGIYESLVEKNFDVCTGPMKPKEKKTVLRIKLIYWLWSIGGRVSMKTNHVGIAGFNFIVKKSFFNKAGGFKVKGIMEDWDLAKKLSKKGAKFHYNKLIAVKTSSRRFQKMGLIKYFKSYTCRYLFFGEMKDQKQYWKDE